MDETPSPENTYSRNGTTPINSPFRKRIQSRNNVAEDDGGVDPIECTGKSCKSCTGGLIADCVAVSCLALVLFLNILAFTFLKIPYLMGRKWLSKGRMKIKSKEKKKWELIKEKTSKRGVAALEGRNGNSRRVSVENEEVGLENEAMELGNEEVKNHFSAQEEEMFWLELYRIGHLGFGRVSFSSCGSSQRKTTITKIISQNLYIQHLQYNL
ncbi:hypothetical protein Leryth_017389 [Lithospermum erythrorhizon]|nr:hypothetical protein Leryth_017389 [Lithospermum erythrorhizon]